MGSFDMAEITKQSAKPAKNKAYGRVEFTFDKQIVRRFVRPLV